MIGCADAKPPRGRESKSKLEVESMDEYKYLRSQSGKQSAYSKRYERPKLSYLKSPSQDAMLLRQIFLLVKGCFEEKLKLISFEKTLGVHEVDTSMREVVLFAKSHAQVPLCFISRCKNLQKLCSIASFEKHFSFLIAKREWDFKE